jgi:hypothetical protein
VALRRGVRSPFRPDDELHAGDREDEEGRRGRTGVLGSGAAAGAAGQTAAQAGGDTGAQASGETGVQAGGEAQAGAADAAPRVEIDLDGIELRVREVPVEPGNYSGLAANDDALFYLSREGAGSGGGTDLMALPFDKDDPEPVTVVENVRSAELSMDGAKILVRRGDDFFVIDARAQEAGNRLDDARVDLRGWSFRPDRRLRRRAVGAAHQRARRRPAQR